MARMILALSAVFFFIIPAFLQAEIKTGSYKGSISFRMKNFPLQLCGRSISFQSFDDSLDGVVPLVKGLLDCYPQLKFAFCVTSLGNLFVIEESHISEVSFFSENTKSIRSERISSRQENSPVTAYHIASMTHETGYYELPRPVPVEAPSIVITQGNQAGSMPGPQGNLRPSAPSSPWRSDGSKPFCYTFIFGLPSA